MFVWFFLECKVSSVDVNLMSSWYIFLVQCQKINLNTFLKQKRTWKYWHTSEIRCISEVCQVTSNSSIVLFFSDWLCCG